MTSKLILSAALWAVLTGCVEDPPECTSLECTKRMAHNAERAARYNGCIAYWLEEERKMGPGRNTIMPFGRSKYEHCGMVAR